MLDPDDLSDIAFFVIGTDLEFTPSGNIFTANVAHLFAKGLEADVRKYAAELSKQLGTAAQVTLEDKNLKIEVSNPTAVLTLLDQMKNQAPSRRRVAKQDVQLFEKLNFSALPPPYNEGKWQFVEPAGAEPYFEIAIPRTKYIHPPEEKNPGSREGELLTNDLSFAASGLIEFKYTRGANIREKDYIRAYTVHPNNILWAMDGDAVITKLQRAIKTFGTKLDNTLKDYNYIQEVLSAQEDREWMQRPRGTATTDVIIAAKIYAQKDFRDGNTRSSAIDLADKLEALSLGKLAEDLRKFHNGIATLARGDIRTGSKILHGAPWRIFTLESTMQKIREALNITPLSDKGYAELQPLMAAIHRHFHDSGLRQAVHQARSAPPPEAYGR